MYLQKPSWSPLRCHPRELSSQKKGMQHCETCFVQHCEFYKLEDEYSSLRENKWLKKKKKGQIFHCPKAVNNNHFQTTYFLFIPSQFKFTCFYLPVCSPQVVVLNQWNMRTLFAIPKLVPISKVSTPGLLFPHSGRLLLQSSFVSVFSCHHLFSQLLHFRQTFDSLLVCWLCQTREVKKNHVMKKNLTLNLHNAWKLRFVFFCSLLVFSGWKSWTGELLCKVRTWLGQEKPVTWADTLHACWATTLKAALKRGLRAAGSSNTWCLVNSAARCVTCSIHYCSVSWLTAKKEASLILTLKINVLRSWSMSSVVEMGF